MWTDTEHQVAPGFVEVIYGEVMFFMQNFIYDLALALALDDVDQAHMVSNSSPSWTCYKREK